MSGGIRITTPNGPRFVVSLSLNVIISGYVLTLGPAFKCCLQDVEFLRIGRSSD